jgi:ADP-ribosylation factor-like protein 5B
MGAIFSALMSMLNSNQQHKLIIVGLDNAGKTTTLYKLHLGEVVMTQPTIGSNVEEVKCGNVSFEVWDLGGQTTLRQSWSSYYRDTAAVIMMVDSTDRARVGLVKEELFKLLGSEALDPKDVLVLANKQDLPDAMTAAELSEALSLHDIKGKEWHIQASCALTGEGLWEGLEWVAARCSGAG